MHPVARRTVDDIHIRLDGRRGVAEQIYGQVRDRITAGTLRPGDLLPSTRQMAERLAVSRNAVSRAYHRLTAENYTTA